MSNLSTLKFSFVIPSFDRADIILEALDSILRESRKSDLPIEIIVVDDFSKDGTEEVVRSWATSNSFGELKFFRLPSKQGACAARNQGIDEARGEYLIFLDSDDQLLPGALGQISNVLHKNPEIGLYYGAIQTKSGRQGALPDTSFMQRPLNFESYIKSKGVGEFLPICKRSELEKGQFLFSDEVQGFESLLWLRLVKEGTLLWIDPAPVRLYDDIREDRLCHPKNLNNDTERLALGFRIILRDYGRVIKAISPDYWQSLVLRAVLYSKLSGSWALTDAVVDDFRRDFASINRLLSITPSAFLKIVYPLLNKFRRI